MSDLTGQQRRMQTKSRLVNRCALLCLVSSGTAALLAPLAGWISGSEGLIALAVASLACLGGAVGGEVAGYAFSRRSDALIRLLTGTLFRLAMPMAVLTVLVLRAPNLVSAGAAYFFVVQYMVVLAIESWLTVQLIKAG